MKIKYFFEHNHEDVGSYELILTENDLKCDIKFFETDIIRLINILNQLKRTGEVIIIDGIRYYDYTLFNLISIEVTKYLKTTFIKNEFICTTYDIKIEPLSIRFVGTSKRLSEISKFYGKSNKSVKRINKEKFFYYDHNNIDGSNLRNRFKY